MRSIWSELKILPNNWVTIDCIWVAIHWLVDYQWLCVAAFDFFSLVFGRSFRRRRKKKKKKNKKKKMKKKKEKKRKINKNINVRIFFHSRLACVVFHLDWRYYPIIECQLTAFEFLFIDLLITNGFVLQHSIFLV